MIDPLQYLWLLLKASLLSTGGSGNVPILYQELIPRGWATEQQFAEAIAIGQISPGPSGLWVISFGYLTYGLLGAVLALIAITIPPLLVIVLAAIYRRAGRHAAIEGFLRGLSLAVVGIFAVVLARLFRGTGIEVSTLLVAAMGLGLGLAPRVPVIGVLMLAAGIGILLF